MIEELRSASEQLQAAWKNYLRVCSIIQDYPTLKTAFHHFPLELSRQLDTEISLISSYEENIQQVKVAIARARNFSSALAPINSLPLEILTRIFHLVTPQVCDLHRLDRKGRQHFPRWSDNLAQVCSLWRKTAILSRSIWTHIDLSSNESFWRGLLARSENHVVRAGSLPIELHIADNRITAFAPAYHELYQFLAQISSRIVSLEFVATSGFRDFHRGVFLELLRCIPKTLTRLEVRSESNHRNASIIPGRPTLSLGQLSSARESDDLYTGLTAEQLENAFALLKVLHLRGIFPQWSSRAYHGLVDLRLTSAEEGTSSIEESMLTNILKSSPMLKLLYFGLAIIRPTPENEHVTPVYLQELQVIKIFLCFDNWTSNPVVQTGIILRLLDPGTKPLRLSIENEPEHNPFSFQELERFFERSNVTHFYNCAGFPAIPTLLRHASDLKVVVLDSCEYRGQSCPNLFQFDEPMASARLKSIYIKGALHVEDLLAIIRFCPTGVVLYNNCQVYTSDYEIPGSARGLLNETEILKMFTTVRITHHRYYSGPDPTAEWDSLE